MTIPTREEALRALDILKLGRDVGNKQVATLRSYIESHTGEVVTYAVFDKTGKLRFVAPNEHDAHMALILSSADPDEFDVATMVKPLYASPVQPVALEWRGSGLCFRDVVIATLERQNLSDPVQWVGRLGIGFDKLASIVWITGDVDNQSARERCKAETEQRARQWLSVGDK